MLTYSKQKSILFIGLIFIVIICAFAGVKYDLANSAKLVAGQKQEQIVDACEISESNEALFVGCNGFF